EVTTIAVAVQGRIIPVEATLQPLPATLSIEAHPGARVLLDGTELGFAPLPTTIATAPGPHRVRITAPGRVPYERALHLRSGDELALIARTPYTRQRRAAWGLLGVAGGLSVAGGITVGLTFAFQARAREVDDGRGEVNLDPAQLQAYNADVGRRDRLRGVTFGLLGTAALAGITGLVLVITDRPDRPDRRRRSRRRSPSPAAATPARTASRGAR
ncbi:MAG: PEGA domain-containing protein, partial [Nannocystaceae bacterium]